MHTCLETHSLYTPSIRQPPNQESTDGLSSGAGSRHHVKLSWTMASAKGMESMNPTQMQFLLTDGRICCI